MESQRGARFGHPLCFYSGLKKLPSAICHSTKIFKPRTRKAEKFLHLRKFN